MSSQDSPERALLITAEKVRMQYRNMPTAFIGSAVICNLMGIASAHRRGPRENYRLDGCCVPVGDRAFHPVAGIQQNRADAA